MSSSRRSLAVLVITVAAALSAVVPAGALAGVLGGGIAGYVTDADTGLGLGGATVSWNGTTSPAPMATTGATGRYLLTGLDPGSAGALAVSGPPGWETTTVPNLTLPAADIGDQSVAVRRDWAATAGGASTTANDDGNAGCPATAASDGDRATGWSATPASHTPADPAALTVALPQTIDVRQLVLDPTAACGHDPGAALGAYRIQTSPDGATWSTAAEGTLDASAQNTTTAIAPSANATAVRYVRLLALAPQDPTAATVDLRELQVFGVGPNLPPSGTLATDAPRNYVKNVVRLRATFTDPDSTITRYLWDFDGDGTFDQATAGPAVAHVWTLPGTYHVTVGVRDFRGGLGTTSIDLRIIDPNATVDPVIQRKPLITFDPVDGIDLPVRIACSSTCTFTASMVLTKQMAKAIKAKHRMVLSFKGKTEGPGLGSWTLELPSKTIKLLRKAHRKAVTVRLTASAVDRQKRRTTVHRWVRFR
ncbi:MAG: hypothetical protein JWQ18_2002 [Conexibacter sp.]|nr:hypothetical protein [Conexibacter sp.]